MKIYLLLVSLAAAGWARPDVSHLQKHTYVPPITSYGVPSSPSQTYLPSLPSSDNLQFQGGYVSGGVPSVSIQTPYVSQVGVPSTISSGFLTSSVQGGSYPAVSYPGSSYFGSSYSSGSYTGGSVPGPTIDIQQQGQVVEHKKSYYFYAAPEEPQPRTRINIPLPPVQKRTNVIFIKAPVNRPQPVPIIVPQGASVEQKTRIYVLVKKPEENVKPIVLPNQAPAPPQKPEVVFVRYRNPQEAEHVIHESLQGDAGASSQDIGNTAFLQNIQVSVESEKQAAADAGADINLSHAPAGETVEKVEGVVGFEGSSGGSLTGGVSVISNSAVEGPSGGVVEVSTPAPLVISSTVTPLAVTSSGPFVVSGGESGSFVSSGGLTPSGYVYK